MTQAPSIHPSVPSEALEATVRALQAQVEQLLAERTRYRDLYLQMLERGLLGQKAEKLAPDDSQLTLALLASLLGEPARQAKAPQSVRSHTRVPPTGRRPLPDSLPRVEIELLPDEVKREGLDAFVRIGEEVSEVVERRCASFVVVRVCRPKFMRKGAPPEAATGRVAVLTAEPAELPIPRGLAGPGLLASSIVQRWQDHLPLHRLEQIYAREGLGFARSTVCTSHGQLAETARPLVEAMWQDALDAPALCIDATGVLVQAKERCNRCHFFVVVAPERHVLYRFSAKHDGAAVDRVLAGYRGYLVADAASVYDHLYREGDVTEVACWAHCRRYFFKALGSEPELAREALAHIRGLFEIERTLAEMPAKKRHRIRQQRSKPLVEDFFRWCDSQAQKVLEQTPIAKAVGYARNHRIAFARFLEDGRLPLHNNASELALRRQAIGRKNWMFIGSDQGAEANTTFVSLLASCQLHGIEPWGYLRDLLCLLPAWPRKRVIALSPLHWKDTLQQEHTQQLLAAKPFRRVVLGLPV